MLIKLTDVDGAGAVFVEHSAILLIARLDRFEPTTVHGKPSGLFIPERTKLVLTGGQTLLVDEMPQVIADMIEDARIGKVGSPDAGSC